jgi:TP901-1 family phage major tail protein
MAKNGTTMVFKKGGTAVGASRSFSLSISSAMIDVSSKDSAFRKLKAGKLGYSISADGVLAFSDAQQEALMDDVLAGTALTWSLGKATPVSGDVVFSGTAQIESVEFSAPDNEAATFSTSAKGSGALVKTTTPP